MLSVGMAAETLTDLLAAGAADAVAISAPGRAPMTHGALRAQIAETATHLRAAGVAHADRVAIVLPNGPEMATAFLGAASAAVAAPLNPAYRAEEFRFYLEDLRASALIVEAASDSPALSVAADLGVRILTLEKGAAAGAFALSCENPPGRPASRAPARPADTALILHTSGTTSRPKIVPLSHANLAASARNIVATLALSPRDTCLNIMPFFHIHGLMAALLASLAAGGEVFCSPGFNALKFAAWLEEARPSWYTAVPSMHQAILARLSRQKDLARAAGLRFIRSSSASLPPSVMLALEDLFGCPVIESYGMTEASHQMASNPLPPAKRKPGSVGLAAGPEIAIMNAAGAFLKPGERGEIVIRGANVIESYENNPAANASTFANGWFRTGDQGALDEDGYLVITGRLKEIINRGGEKIAPREVDEALLGHPAVAEAVTFALPHDKLGEEVAAAIVLKDGQAASEAEIRAHAAARLADFKVPRRIVFLSEIPKGPSGKAMRIGLAEKLGLAS